MSSPSTTQTQPTGQEDAPVESTLTFYGLIVIAQVLGSATAQKLVDTVFAIETVKDIRTLRPLLQKA